MLGFFFILFKNDSIRTSENCHNFKKFEFD